MNTQDLKKFIDRVLGSSIRCLLPSYWWKRIFHAVVDKCDAEVASVASAVDSIEQEVGSKVDYVIVSGQDSDIEKNKEAYKFIKARGYDKPLYIWYRNTPTGNHQFRVDYRLGGGYWDVIDGAMKWYIALFNVNFTEGDRTLNTFFVKLYEDGTLSGLNLIYEDSYMSDTSERAVQNKVVKAYVDESVASLATKDELAESEEVAAAALVDLEGRKADREEVVKAIAELNVPTLATKEELTEAEEVAAAALNDLDNRLKEIVSQINI
jgi:hypothetical protein